MKTLKRLEDKRIASAFERGFIVVHNEDPVEHKRISDRWWTICEELRRTYVRVDVSSDGKRASVYIDSWTAWGDSLSLKVRACIHEMFMRYLDETTVKVGGRVTCTLSGYSPTVAERIAQAIARACYQEEVA